MNIDQTTSHIVAKLRDASESIVREGLVAAAEDALIADIRTSGLSDKEKLKTYLQRTPRFTVVGDRECVHRVAHEVRTQLGLNYYYYMGIREELAKEGFLTERRGRWITITHLRAKSAK